MIRPNDMRFLLFALVFYRWSHKNRKKQVCKKYWFCTQNVIKIQQYKFSNNCSFRFHVERKRNRIDNSAIRAFVRNEGGVGAVKLQYHKVFCQIRHWFDVFVDVVTRPILIQNSGKTEPT